MTPRLLLLSLCLLSEATGLCAEAGPFTTLPNTELLFPATALVTNGVPGLTNPPSKMMVSGVASVSAQGGQVSLVSTQEWVQRFHGSVNSYDLASAVAVDPAGNVYATGQSSDILGEGYATVKYADQLVYRPPANFIGTDTFTFTATDDLGRSATAVASVVVSSPWTPTNDDFSNAIPVVGTNLTLSADNTYASSQPGEPQHTPTAVGKSLWWTWTAPADGELELGTTTEGPWWVETTVYIGDALSSLTPLGVSSNKTRYPLFLGVRQGQLYRIAADSVDNTYGPFLMSLNFWATPPNDWFTNRAVLSTNGTAFDIALGNASREAREPLLKGGYKPQASGRTLWWTFTPPSAGTLSFSASTVDAHTYVSIGVFRGTRLGALTRVLTGTTSIEMKLQAGIPYQILVDPWLAVDPWGSHLETLHIESQFYPLPANDKVARATPLIGPSVAITDNNLAARQQAGEPRPAQFQTLGASLWYTWTAPDTGWAYVTASSQYFEPIVAVYQGARPGALHRVAQTVKEPPSVPSPPVGFAASKGTIYQIEVDGLKEEGAQPGPFELDLEFTTLRLTSPTNGLVCDQSSLPTLAINVPNPEVDGHLSSVSYLLYNADLGPQFGTNLDEPPFMAQPTELAPGRYGAIAYATNDVGRTLLSPPVTFTVRPPGDDFSQAVQMSGYQWQLNGTVSGASLQRGEPLHTGKGIDSSVWTSWTAPASGPVTLTTSFPEAIHLEAFSGTNLTHLQRVQPTTTNGWVYAFNAVAGATYDFAVCHRPMPAGFEGEDFSVALALDVVGLTSPTPSAGTPTAPPAAASVLAPGTGTKGTGLQIVQQGATIKLTWPASSGPVLESSADLANPTAWQPVTNSATLDTDQRVLSLPVERGARFFRLK